MLKSAKLKEYIIALVQKELEETSTTGSGGEYGTPNAFSKDKNSTTNRAVKDSEGIGFTKAKETHKNFVPMKEAIPSEGLPKEDLELAAKLSQSLYDLLSEKQPFYAFDEWKHELIATKKFSDNQIKSIVKAAADRKGQVNANRLKQDVRDNLLWRLSPGSAVKESTKKINEITYQQYKKDPALTSKQKLNVAIKECNRALFEIQRYLNQNKKLKEEEQVGYWKSTAFNLVKMNERVKGIQKQIKKLGLKEVMLEIENSLLQKKKDFIIACNTELKPKDHWTEDQLSKIDDKKVEIVYRNRIKMCPDLAKTYNAK